MANYVKFYRGSSVAFENLLNKNSDTLYFITDSDSNISSLYLGDKLIAEGITQLNQLKDIIISDSIDDNQVLVFDKNQNKWINKSLIEAIGVMIGASATKQGGAGLVPAPGINQHNRFLRGDGSWVDIETGSHYFGDEKTIESNGITFSLKDFEKKYYAFIPASGSQEEGNFIAAHYEAREVSEIYPWKENLEPKVVEENGTFVLGWFEPDLTLFNDITNELNSFQNKISNIDKTIEGLQNVDSSLLIELNNKPDKNSVYTKEETENKINEFISSAQHLIRKVFDSIEDAEAFILTINNPSDYVYMIKNTSTTTSDKYTEYLYIDNELEPVGSWDVNLDDYVTTDQLATLLNNKVDIEEGKTLISETELEKLAEIESGAQKNYINSVNNIDFTVDNNGKLELNSISISKITNLETLLNSKASASSVNALENTVSIINGNVTELLNKTNTLENSISETNESISALAEELTSNYLTKNEFSTKMNIVDGEIGTLKGILTWVTLD